MLADHPFAAAGAVLLLAALGLIGLAPAVRLIGLAPALIVPCCWTDLVKFYTEVILA